MSSAHWSVTPPASDTASHAATHKDRNHARRSGDFEAEKQLNNRIKQSVKKDRADWLDYLLAAGDWGEIRKLRKGFCPNQGRLKNAAGHLVDSNDRAETLAQYNSEVQWAVRPTTLLDTTAPIGPPLPLNTGRIQESEVIGAAGKLRRKKASGNDQIPPEFWKALCMPESPAVKWATALCNKCWEEKAVPQTWHEALVTAIFKKGDVASCENYRPISLLPIGYKLYAAVLLSRLKAAGAEARIWKTQYGFRSGRGTSEALFVARRLMDDTWAQKAGSLIFLALDWAKAFDSVSPSALLTALRRFGVPAEFVEAVGSIYTDRTFSVKDAGSISSQHPQFFGISQGCPLSPFLFSILVTLLISDATRKLHSHMGPPTDLPLDELIYADDTLVVGVQADRVQAFMRYIQQAGENYGLSFNWRKLELLPVRCEAAIAKPDGNDVVSKDSIVYLGSLLSKNGKIGPELSRRLGAAKSDFCTLAKVWSHSNISMQKKLKVFDACVTSKLLYCLHTAWLNSSELGKLNAFQARCLRKIAGIPHSYLSRISNDTVLQTCKCEKLSSVLHYRQLQLFGRLAQLPDEDITRQVVLKRASFELKDLIGPRKRGRPRHIWSNQVYSMAVKAADNVNNLHALLQQPSGVWQATARQFCSQI